MRDVRWLWYLWSAAGGWAAVCLVLKYAPGALRRPPHLRPNYRDRPVAGTMGILLVVPACLGTAAGIALWWAGEADASDAAATGAAAIAMGLLGFADDLWGHRRARGFGGHLRALLRGEITTGALKASGGAAVGVAVSAWVGRRGWWLLTGAAVVALSANLANLLDLRPGRAAKVWLAAGAALVAFTVPGAGIVVAAAAGGLLAFLPSDLRERAMLGDAGANLLGTLLGAAAVASLGRGALTAVLAVLVALTAASEVVSFTRVIERVPPLRALDRFGRAP